MTVSTATNKVTFAGNGATTVFAFPFPIQAAADVRVVLRDSAGTETVKVLTTDYTVSASPWTSGGTVTMLTAPDTGETLLIKRSVEITQLSDYRDGDELPAETLEANLDKLTYIAQQINEALQRAVLLQEVTALSGLTLPDPSSGTVLYSPDGLSLLWGALATLGGGSVALPLAVADGGTGAITAAAARLNLGENASGSPFTRKHNYSATTAPTVADDTSAGYSVGSWWFDNTNDEVHTCIDATASAAVWVRARNDAFPGFKNRITNGDVRIDQRNAGAAVSVNSTSTFFGPDMWRATGQAADGVFSVARSTATPPAGFSHFLRVTATTADASIGAAQQYALFAPLEGSDMADLGFGAAGAQSVTLSFRVRSSLTGSFSGALTNGSRNRSYPFSFTIDAANTWETKSITIAGDTSGTWPTDNTQWGSVCFDLGAGTSVRAAAGAWTATANVAGVTGAVSLLGTLNATLDLTGVQLEIGPVATAFERRSFAERLARCQRYYSKSYNLEVVPGTSTEVGASVGRGLGAGTTTIDSLRASLPVRMRTTPTITWYSTTGASGNIRDASAAANVSVSSNYIPGETSTGAPVVGTGPASANLIVAHWTGSAEL